MLNELNQEASDVLIRKSALFVRAMEQGADDLNRLRTDLMNLHCLCGFISELYLLDGKYYIGNRETTTNEISKVRSMIQYYNTNDNIDITWFQPAPDLES